MPEPITPNFEAALEADIERLSVELKERRDHPEMQGLSGHEKVREAIRAISPAPAPTDDTPAAAQTNVFQNPLPDYAKNATPETKLEIETLLESAFRDGLAKASAAAAKSNPFVLDAFHDALAGKLYPELKKRGIVE